MRMVPIVAGLLRVAIDSFAVSKARRLPPTIDRRFHGTPLPALSGPNCGTRFPLSLEGSTFRSDCIPRELEQDALVSVEVPCAARPIKVSIFLRAIEDGFEPLSRCC